ncbi:MAG: hypothetical protein M1816_004102 [Peltula sp. TS41687]|nr:MAG: hypothetical protein M1816_004102 [Peltula sp. TS41687]
MAESSAHLNCRQTAARRIPELDGTVLRRRGELAAVGREGDGADRTAMPRERRQPTRAGGRRAAWELVPIGAMDEDSEVGKEREDTRNLKWARKANTQRYHVTVGQLWGSCRYNSLHHREQLPQNVISS